VNDIYVVSGPGTRELLYEVAAGAVIGATCGFHEQGAGCTGGFNTDHYTGLEARFIAEVARAVLGMARQDANTLVLELLKSYESTLSAPNRGYPFSEVYDPETVQPSDSWLGTYYDVKDAISGLGLNFAYH
jgi:methylamine--corrinoid protein Co-methyltransferase